MKVTDAEDAPVSGVTVSLVPGGSPARAGSESRHAVLALTDAAGLYRAEAD